MLFVVFQLVYSCFQNKRAAELAVQTVKQYKEKTKSKIKVIFNVFKEEDERLYKQLLG